MSRNKPGKIRVLFVCLGNICRSPTAHGVFESMVRDAGLSGSIEVDSAGTSGWHEGGRPDDRAIALAAERGIDLCYIHSRKVTSEDFETFYYLLAMDNNNYDDLLVRSPERFRHRVKLFLEFTGTGKGSVPDPYFGGGQGFEDVFELISNGCRSLLKRLGDELESR